MLKPKLKDHTAYQTENQEPFRPILKCAIALFLIGATFLGYWQVHDFGFINLDDDQYITANPQVKSGLTLRGLTWAFTTNWDANWFPLTWLSHMLDCEIYGLNPGGHHVTNLIFHLANTLLLFLVFQRMTGKPWQSGFIAGLFALHPLHVESVAWVAERKDVLSTFFWMLTLWAYVRYTERPRLNKYLWMLVSFVFGLMSKPMLVTLPFVLLLLDYWPLRRFHPGQWRQQAFSLMWEKTPLFVLSAVSSGVTFLIQRSGGAVGSFDLLPLQVRIANALVSYAGYLGKMIWPQNLAVYYPYLEALPVWQVAGSAVVLAAVTLLAIFWRRKAPSFLVGWFWYLGTLVPVIGLVQVGGQAMADRYTYVPLTGLFIMIVMGIPEVLSQWRISRPVIAASAGMALIALLVATRIQASHWKNSVALFEHTLALTSENYLIHNNIGTALARQGRFEEAVAHYRETLRIKPRTPRTYFNLGNALVSQGKFEEATAQFQEALRLKPDYAEAYNNLANVLDRQGKAGEAVLHYAEALRFKPDYAEAQSNLGVVLARQGKVQEAMGHFQKAIVIDPYYEKAYHNLGVALGGQGKSREAIALFTEALRLNPGFVEARFSLGMAYAAIGDQGSVLRQYTLLKGMNPEFARLLLGKISR